jgi:hypothetical protein
MMMVSGIAMMAQPYFGQMARKIGIGTVRYTETVDRPQLRLTARGSGGKMASDTEMMGRP